MLVYIRSYTFQIGGLILNQLKKDTQVNFRTNSQVLQEAKAVFAEKHLDASQGFNMFLEFVASRKELPFKTNDELEREKLIDQLQKRVQHNESEINKGNYTTLNQLEREFFE